MIAADPTQFPGNIVQTLYNYFHTMDSDWSIVRRPVRTTDDIQAIGITVTDWNPDMGSMEMGGYASPGYQVPTLSDYLVNIQGLVTDTEEERGIATHSAMAKAIRVAVAMDPNLRIALAALQTSFGLAKTERVQRFTVPGQRYLGNEIRGTWYYLSITEFRLTTETT